MTTAKSFAPCHITGAFQILDRQTDALHDGSRGIGASLSRGVETTLKAELAKRKSVRIKISINGSVSPHAQVSKHVIDMFTSRFEEARDVHIDVKHRISVPIGAGFGTSGAAALSLSLALNEVFCLGLSRIEAAQIAHVAEVECRTGLGTVIAETFGGLEIRTKAGAPGIGEIRNFPASEGTSVACLVFGPLSTRKYLTDKSARKRINELGGKSVKSLLKDSTVENFMRISRQFAEHVALITARVRKVLDEADRVGIVCSMPMFGEAVFTIADSRSLEKALGIFREHGPTDSIITCEIDREGARLLK